MPYYHKSVKELASDMEDFAKMKGYPEITWDEENKEWLPKGLFEEFNAFCESRVRHDANSN